MLKFSADQFTAIEARKEASFYDELRHELRAFIAEKLPDVSEERADGRISRAFELWKVHGFEFEKEITEPSFILVTFPNDFDQKPAYAWLDGVLRFSAPARSRLERIKGVIRAGADA
ncbi:MAG: hypothetical protein MK180_04855 [Rhodobacteraceae bacterium]|nr:hypothetical protein [Paracoccaceae bacterium]